MSSAGAVLPAADGGPAYELTRISQLAVSAPDPTITTADRGLGGSQSHPLGRDLNNLALEDPALPDPCAGVVSWRL